MKKLIPALCMLLVAAALLGTSTFAWFSMNTKVDATGMQVKATAASSLVITDTAGNINTTATNTIGMTAVTTAISPATHLNGQSDGSNTLSYSSGDTNLVYVTNADEVDAVTGYAQTDKTLKYAKVAVGAAYYIDYTVYIAAKGEALSAQDLTAKITPSGTQTIYNAISVDYWVNGTYVATDSFADAADGEKIITNGAIPSAGAASDNYITVLMRVYFDGELANGSTGSAYVNNGTIDTSAVTFAVSFTTAPHA